MLSPRSPRTPKIFWKSSPGNDERYSLRALSSLSIKENASAWARLTEDCRKAKWSKREQGVVSGSSYLSPIQVRCWCFIQRRKVYHEYKILAGNNTHCFPRSQSLLQQTGGYPRVKGSSRLEQRVKLVALRFCDQSNPAVYGTTSQTHQCYGLEFDLRYDDERFIDCYSKEWYQELSETMLRQRTMFTIHLSLSIVRYAFAWANWTGGYRQAKWSKVWKMGWHCDLRPISRSKSWKPHHLLKLKEWYRELSKSMLKKWRSVPEDCTLVKHWERRAFASSSSQTLSFVRVWITLFKKDRWKPHHRLKAKRTVSIIPKNQCYVRVKYWYMRVRANMCM